jgi:hypothetical protein
MRPFWRCAMRRAEVLVNTVKVIFKTHGFFISASVRYLIDA